jgi:hypothetical protein
MELTADMLRELQGCRSDAARPGDRRRRPRVGARLLATISAPHCEAVRASVRVRDVSSGGIAFLFPRPLQIGATFVLHVPATRNRTKRVPCEVTRCERVSSDLYRIGAMSDESEE